MYEAGPTGYALVRLLRSAKLPAEVVATSKTPRMTDSSAKTDRLDCQKLAEYAAKGLLTFVSVPTEHQESDRQVVRLLDQLASKRKRTMQQIKSFLLQHGISWPGGNRNEVLLKRLTELDVTSELMFTLYQYVDQYEFLCSKIKETKAELRKIFSSERHSSAIKIFKLILAWVI